MAGATTQLGVGLVGAGEIGAVHAEVLLSGAVAGARLVAVADPRADPPALPVPVVAGLPELLDLPAVDVVAVATPPHLHAPLALQALRAGRHVLLEKPPVLHEADAVALLDAATAAGRVVRAGFHARWGPAVVTAAAHLRGALIAQVEVVYREDVHRYHPGGGWVFDRARAGGGVVMDSGVNAMSVLSALGAVAGFAVEHAELREDAALGVETAADVVFRTRDGRGRMTLEWDWQGPEVRQVAIRTGDGRAVVVDLVRQRATLDGSPLTAGDAAREHVNQHEEYVGVYEDLVRAVAHGESDVGLAELRAVLAVYAAAG